MRRLNEALQQLAGQGHFSSAPQPPKVEAVPVAPLPDASAVPADDQVKQSIELAGQLAELMEQIGDGSEVSLPLQLQESASAGFVESTETSTLAPVVVDTMPGLSPVDPAEPTQADERQGEAQLPEATGNSIPHTGCDTATRIEALRVELGILTRQERGKHQVEEGRSDDAPAAGHGAEGDKPDSESGVTCADAGVAQLPAVSGADAADDDSVALHDTIDDKHPSGVDTGVDPVSGPTAVIDDVDQDALRQVDANGKERELHEHVSERPPGAESGEIAESSTTADDDLEPDKDGAAEASDAELGTELVVQVSPASKESEVNADDPIQVVPADATTTDWTPPTSEVATEGLPSETGPSNSESHPSSLVEASSPSDFLASNLPKDPPEQQQLGPTLVLSDDSTGEPSEPENSTPTDSADAVLKLVEQVLGLQPATLSSSGTGGSDSAETLPTEASESPAEAMAAVVSDDADTDETDPAWEPPPQPLQQVGSAYTPVLGTWAVVSPMDAAPTDEGSEPAAANSQPVVTPVDADGSSDAVRDGISESETFPAGAVEVSAPALSPPPLRSVPPTAYETQMAQRLLEGDYGSRIKLLHDQIRDLDGDQPKAVLLVSSDAGDHTASPTVGLGMYRCGGQDLPTLILDADLAAHRISQHFERLQGPGLIEALAGDLAWSEVVQHTSCEKLQLMARGGTEAGQFALDHLPDIAARSSRLLKQLKEHYGMIIVDGGQVDAPLIPSLTRAADATFVCVRLGVSRREALVAAIERLQRAGGKITGCITTADS